MFIVTLVFWMQRFQRGGLGEVVRHPGHHDRRTSPLFDSFLWRYVKDKVFSTPVPDITNLKTRITDTFATTTERRDKLTVTFVTFGFLDAKFPNRWTGRDGPKPWPPRSPDITPL